MNMNIVMRLTTVSILLSNSWMKRKENASGFLIIRNNNQKWNISVDKQFYAANTRQARSEKREAIFHRYTCLASEKSFSLAR